MKDSPILLEVFKHRFASIAEEMGVTLQRTSFSPNIKERRDFSCALFDKNGDMVAQAAHIPVHLGSMPLSVASAIEHYDFFEGDMVILNDPFQGGTHLPDITLVTPVFIKGTTEFYVANRAHHADVGGMSPGSMPLSTTIYQEGIIIPPLKLIEQGKLDKDLMAFLLSNVRTPAEREGDLSAQIMANRTGITRLQDLVEKYSLSTVSHYASRLMDYSERMARHHILNLPDGTYQFKDYMEDDGQHDGLIPIHVSIRIEGDQMEIDFTESADQVPGCVNAVYAITLSCAMYVLRALFDEDIPTNAGCFRPLEVVTQSGSIVDAVFPAAVAGGNVETSQRIVDSILGALSQALPEKIPAASQGTMNNLTIGGLDETGAPFAYYETIGGGCGATASQQGDSAVQSHMTNTLNTPIEALEFNYPFMMTKYAIRKDSGGKGRFRGGDGIIREIKLQTEADITVLSERRKLSPFGLMGGEAGKKGINIVLEQGRKIRKPGKFQVRLHDGDVIRIETPGGGGYGKKKNN
jgi:N-methylhydantoinase B